MVLYEIHWEVTNKCNLRCKHCLSSSGRSRANELSTSEAIAALEGFYSAGVGKIYFTGGEPFIRHDFLKLIQKAVILGMEVEVITNATLLKKRTLETIKECDVKLGISLDGADSFTNDAIRGKGTFGKIVKVLQECQVFGIPTKLYMTVTKDNIDQILALGRIAKAYGCREVHFNEVTLTGRAKEFANVLALSSQDRCDLPLIITRVAQEVFTEALNQLDDQCWIDGTFFYMTAEGDLYLCSEIFQRYPNLSIGNIQSFNFRQWKKRKSKEFIHQKKCCYGVQISEHIVFVSNILFQCAFASDEHSRIETFNQLHQELDILYRGIGSNCLKCKDQDCMGYVWLLNKEAQRLYEQGIPLVQINNGPTFIHSFPAMPNGKLKLGEKYPSCSQLCLGSRRCSIYMDRPLVCRLYPLGLETTRHGQIVWALHRDCLHVRKLEESGLLPYFEQHALSIIHRLSPQLLFEIIETYRAVDAISLFPDGKNNYSTLKEVKYVKV